eukprot:scaffold62869_cov67-Phaeocystis_antarctica.AAC.2
MGARSGRAAGAPRAYSQHPTCPCAIAPDTGSARRARVQAAHLLYRHHLLLAGRLALRHVVHLHVCGGQAIGEVVVELSAGSAQRVRGRKGLRATAYACAPARQGRACC